MQGTVFVQAYDRGALLGETALFEGDRVALYYDAVSFQSAFEGVVETVVDMLRIGLHQIPGYVGFIAQ